MTFNFGIPQIIYMILTAFGIVVACVNHGKEREPYNAYVQLISAILVTALLAWGGFFS